jgi:hypothetical protein
MISIKTSVKVVDALEIIQWAFHFVENANRDFEPTVEQLLQIAEYCVEGQDSWEAAAAIMEGRKLPKPRRSKKK